MYYVCVGVLLAYPALYYKYYVHNINNTLGGLDALASTSC